MDERTRLAILKEIYRVHNEAISGLSLACQIRCADCCTRNVTMTRLEGLNIVRNLSEEQRKNMEELLRPLKDGQHFRPLLTVNGMADRCAAGEPLPDERLDPKSGSCPLLKDEVCSVYPFRPFECRSFVSLTVCRNIGHAEMSPLTVNTNNLIRQYIEHIDADGQSGNLTDVLLHLLGDTDVNLISNRSASVLMIDPVHRAPLNDLMEKLNTIRV